MANFVVRVQAQRLEVNAFGYRIWVIVQQEKTIVPERTAVVISDMWDAHWSAGATARTGLLADRVNAVVELLRERGILIAHCPSDTMDFYRDDPARERLLAEVGAEPNVVRDIFDIPLPIDDTDGGSDTLDRHAPDTIVWTRQSPKIRIDSSRDVIAGDEGGRLCAYFQRRGIDTVLYMGVHTGMCILNRTFGIKRMSAWGMDCVLFADLTDAMYNPGRPPYVSHEEGTKLVVSYIEKFYCPTTSSDQLQLFRR